METLQRLHNRGSISTVYDIDGSICLEDAKDQNFVKNYSGDGDRRTWTYSTWVKKGEFGSANFDYMYMFAAQYTSVHFMNNGVLRVALYNGSTTVYADTTQVFRDGSAWYNIIVQLDSTQSTASDRVKIWINGARVTSFNNSTYTNMSQNEQFQIGQASANYQVGYFFAGGGSNYGFSGYMAETHYVNGTALDETSFGEFDSDSGIWKPKEYTGSHGSKGFYLKFTNASNIGEDSATSGIGDFSPNANTTSASLAQDSPTNNFATINPLQGNSDKLIISNGATNIVKSGNHGWQTTNANIAVSVGKWYAEFKLDTNCTLVMLGVNQADNEAAWYGSHIGAYSNSTAQGMGYYSQNGYFYRNGGSGAIANTYTAGDIIGIAFCYNSNGTAFMGMSKNGTWQNSQDPSSGTTGMLGLNYGSAFTNNEMFTFAISTHENTGGVLANFGGYHNYTVSSGNTDANGYGNFEYAVPTDYYALCTENLAEFG